MVTKLFNASIHNLMLAKQADESDPDDEKTLASYENDSDILSKNNIPAKIADQYCYALSRGDVSSDQVFEEFESELDEKELW